MDTTAFASAVSSDAAGGGGDEGCLGNLSMDAHLQLTILAAIAIIKHVILLGLVIVALTALIAIYTFALVWLALLWLQTRLLFLSAALLRGCMNAEFLPAKIKLPSDEWVDDNVEHAQAAKDKTEDAQPTTVAGPSPQHSLEDIHAQSEYQQRKPLPAHDQQHMLPENGERLDDQPYIEKDGQESELGTTTDLTANSASRRIDAAEKATAATWNNFADSSLQHSARQTPRPLKSELRVKLKLTTEEKKAQEKERKAQEQTLWLEKMVKGSQHDQDLTANRSHNEDDPMPTNPFNTTPSQLAEARAFMRSAVQSVGKHGRQQQHGAPAHRAAPKPGPRPNKALPAVNTSPAGEIPPHLRKSIETKARKTLGAQSLATEDTRASLATVAPPIDSSAAKPGAEPVVDHDYAVREVAKEAPESFKRPNATADAKVIAQDVAECEKASVVQRETVASTIEQSEQEQHEQTPIHTHARPVQKERLAFYDDTPAIHQPAQMAMSAQALKALDRSSELESALVKRIEAAERIVGGEDSQRLADLKNLATSADVNVQPQSTTGLEFPTPVHETDKIALAPATDSNGPHSRLPLAAEFEATCMASQQDRKAVKGSLTPKTVALKEVAEVIKNRVEAQKQLNQLSPSNHNLTDLDATAVNPIAFGPFSPGWWMRDPLGVKNEQNGVPRLAFGNTSSASSFPPGLGPARWEHQAAFDALVEEQRLKDAGAEGPVNDSHPNEVSNKAPEHTKTVSQPGVIMEIAEQATRQSNARAISDEPFGEPSTPQSVENVASKPIEDQAALHPHVDEPGASKTLQKQQKKEARVLIKEAWLDREDARRRVAKSNDWSIENMQALEKATKHYLQCRDRLESFMVGGRLMEEEARVFPVFGVHDVTPPKHRPAGLDSICRKEEVKAKEDEPARTTRSAIDVHKENLDAAYKLRMQALEYAKTPDRSKKSQRIWRAQADAKLKRATDFYRKKREALATAYGGEGLPRELDEAYPVCCPDPNCSCFTMAS